MRVNSVWKRVELLIIRRNLLSLPSGLKCACMTRTLSESIAVDGRP
jgi:hypothetical protein